MARYLFSDVVPSEFFGEKKAEANTYIHKLSPESLKSNDESKLVEDTYKQYKLEQLVVLKDNISTSNLDYNEKRLAFTIPYIGDSNLFHLIPSTFRESHPVEGIVFNSEKNILISIPASDSRMVIAEIEKICEKIDKSLIDISKQCEAFNSSLRQEIERNIKKRYQDIRDLEVTAEEVENLLREKMKHT